MKRRHRVWIALIVLAAIAAIGAAWSQQRSDTAESEDEQPVAVVTQGRIEETIPATGNVVAAQEATLAFSTNGLVAEILVAEGEKVAAGDTLARLDVRAQDRQVAQAVASLNTALVRLEQVQQPPTQADIISAQAALESAQQQYEQVLAGPTDEELTSAQARLDSALTRYNTLRSGPPAEELASAKAALDTAQASVQQAQANYDRVKYSPDIQMRPEALQLQSATIELENAQARYESVIERPNSDDLSAAEADIAQARAQLAELQALPRKDDIAAAQAQVAQAQAQLAVLQDKPNTQEVAVAQAQVEEARLALEQAKEQLEDAILLAPFSGTILSVEIGLGEWTTPGAPAMVLATTDNLRLEVTIDQIDVAQLRVGQAAHVRVEALRDTEMQGQLSYLAPSSIDVNGATAYAAFIRFTPADIPVLVGMTANVEIVTGTRDDAVLVPNRAIRADRQAGTYSVTLQLADGSTQQVEVSLGLRSDEFSQITEGLQVGDQVVMPTIPSGDTDDNNRFGGPPPFVRD